LGQPSTGPLSARAAVQSPKQAEIAQAAMMARCIRAVTMRACTMYFVLPARTMDGGVSKRCKNCVDGQIERRVVSETTERRQHWTNRAQSL
jgi:hypothetical protein